MSRSGLVIALATLALTAACGKAPETSNGILGDRLAPAAVEDSFKVSDDSFTVALKKSSLKKAFLLIPSLKSTGIKAQWEDQAPILISFERYGNRVAMMELVQTIYDAIESEQLIATFDIKEETPSEIKFDFSTGLTSLPMGSSYIDPTETAEQVEARSNGLRPGFEVKSTIVRRISVENNEIKIEQLSRILQQKVVTRKTLDLLTRSFKDAQTLETTETSYVANFEILPYKENPNFKKVEPDGERRAGFFGVRVGVKNTTATKALAQHWDTSPERGPIRVLLSKEIPEQYVKAAVEGITYWNRVIGRDVLKVETNADVRDVPPYRAIVVRWIPWLDAGFAYAGMQADPLTGETLRGQIFMTSSFASITKAPAMPNGATLSKAPQGLLTQPLCDIVPMVQQSVPAGADNTRAAADMIRGVIAHEMGHVLGLRHNFAGSFNSDFETKEMNQQTRNYLADPNYGGRATTTTVMDYVNGTTMLLMSEYIKSNVLPYDKMAIDWAYNGKELPKVKDTFCSDEETIISVLKGIKILGCASHDSGSNPVMDAFEPLRAAALGQVKSQIPMLLQTMFPKPGDPPSRYKTEDLMAAFQRMLTPRISMGTGTEFVRYMFEKEDAVFFTSIRSLKSTLNDVNFSLASFNFETNSEDEGLKETLTRLFSKEGGFTALLRKTAGLTADDQIDQGFPQKQAADFLKTNIPVDGKTAAGQPYVMTEAQLNLLKATFSGMIEKVRVDLMNQFFHEVLPGEGFTLRDLFDENEAKELSKLMKALVLMKGDRVEIRKGVTASPAIFDFETRKRAALVLKTTLLNIEGGGEAVDSVTKELAARLRVVAGLPPAKEDDYLDEDTVKTLANAAKKMIGTLSPEMSATVMNDAAVLIELEK